MRKRRQLLPLLTLVLAVFGQCIAQDTADKQKEVNRLIKELGNESFKVRKAARNALLDHGAVARRSLKAMKDVEDPEVRSAVNDLIEQLRSSLVPGAEQEIKELFIELEAGGKGSDTWKAVAAINPDHMGELVIEVSRNSEWKDALESGVYIFLANADPRNAAAIVSKLSDGDRKQLIRILDRTDNAQYTMKPKQMVFLYCLGENARAVNRAYGVWERGVDQQAIDIAAMAIGRSGDAQKFWGIGGRKIFFEDSLRTRCKLMSFYCGIAQRLGKKQLVRGFLSLGGVDGAGPGDAEPILAILKKVGDEDLITRFLNECRGVTFKYETLYRFYRENGQTISEDEWKALLDEVHNEPELYKLFSVVGTYNLAHAKDLLKRITTAGLKGSNYDALAYKALAKYAESAGQLSLAAEYWTKMVEIKKQDGTWNRVDKANQLHANELKTLIELNNDAFSELMLAGLQLELDGKETEAVALYKKAIDMEPRQTCSYQRIIRIYRDRGDYIKLNAITKQMLQNKPLTSREKLEWGYRLSDVGDYDAAEAMMNEYAQTSDAQLYVNYPKAILAERQGKLEEADNAYAELLKRTGSYGAILRQNALVKIKLRKLEEAEDLLLNHLIEQPFDRYARLLLFYCRSMRTIDDSVALAAYLQASNSQSGDWVHWLHLHALGTVDDAGLIEKANTFGPEVKHYGHRCEAYFYSGLQAMIRGDNKEAASYFKKTMDMNITIFIEHNWAKYELEQLKNDD